MTITKAAVLGAGTMGADIAFAYALKGVQTTLYSRSETTLATAQGICRQNAEIFVEAGFLAEEEKEAVLSRIHPTQSLAEAVKDAQWVLETIKENVEAKQTLYAQLDELLPMDTIVASNTSYLDVFAIFPERRKSRFVITHWFAPAHILPLVEVVKGEGTAEETVLQAMAFSEQIGKLPLRMDKFVRGFLVNRLQAALSREMFALVDQGVATPEQIDLAVKASIMPRGAVLGLFQKSDFAGLEIGVNAENAKVSPKLKERLERGELGVKTGKGWYDYSGHTREEMLKRRDIGLLEVLKACGPYMEHPLQEVEK